MKFCRLHMIHLYLEKKLYHDDIYIIHITGNTFRL